MKWPRADDSIHAITSGTRRGSLEGAARQAQSRSGYTLNTRPFHVSRDVLISNFFGSRWRLPWTTTFEPTGIIPSLSPAASVRAGGASTTFHTCPSALTFMVACGPARLTGDSTVPEISEILSA